MFSDTHFHFDHLCKEIGTDGSHILTVMAQRDCAFGLDIGTRAEDLPARQTCVEKAISSISDLNIRNKVSDFMYFSAGIWPDTESINNRVLCMEQLKSQISLADEKSKNNENCLINRKIIAIGECGIDHHWNPSGVDGRCESDFDNQTYLGERELFEMQLSLAKETELPILVHSRDGFEDTLDCIKNIGYHNGIIHCYSYGLEEAKQFLDLGWYISLSGSVTYTKKSKMEEMISLLKYIPDDRILCETDSPYLAPVPHRGEKNNPINVEFVYDFVSKARNLTKEDLSQLVDSNIQTLFFGKN